jgi:RecA/RadA recombinase
MAQEAAIDGISPEMAEAVRKQASFDNEIIEENISFRERYTRSMKNNAGLKTFVDQIDDEIGSIPKGAMCTLAGFTGSFKTTWAVNIAIKNVLEGKKVAYISLEVSKEQLEYSVMSLFSNDTRFTRMGYHPLELKKIMQNKLYDDELNFLCDVLEPEYRRVIEPNFKIIDRSYFKTYGESEFVDILYRTDDDMPIDAIFVDHVGELALRSPLYNGNNTGAIINKYVSFFGGLTVDFRKKDNEKRMVATVLVAQTNRSGFKEAFASFKKLSMVNRPGDKNKALNTQVDLFCLSWNIPSEGVESILQ